MIETGQYIFFSIEPDGTATSFSDKLSEKLFESFKVQAECFNTVSCSHAEYETTVDLFSHNPYPTGELLNWVCRDNPEYLELDWNLPLLCSVM